MTDLARHLRDAARHHALAAQALELAADDLARSAPVFLDTAAVAAMLSTTRERVHQLTTRRQFPPPDGRDGRRPLWTRETVEAYVRGQR